MNLTLNIEYDRKKIELFWFNLCIILYFGRTSIPFFKYPFLLFYSLLIMYVVSHYRNKLLSTLKNILKSYVLILVLFIYLILSCIFSDKIHLDVVKDILNVFVLLTILFVLKVLVNLESEFLQFRRSFLKLIIFFALVISINNINQFFYLSSYANYSTNRDKATVDYNFALLPVFFGIISILYFFARNLKKSQMLILNILLLVFSFNILISGSKRGMLMFLIIFLIIFSIQILGWFKNNADNWIEKLRKNSVLFFISFCSLMILILFLTFGTSLYFKNNLLDSIRVKDKTFIKYQISHIVYRYASFFNKKANYELIHKNIWNIVFDPKNPESGWANGVYKIVPNLSGENVDIVPENTKGYMLDSTCIGASSGHHAYFFLPIKQYSASFGDSIEASVYCYASENFDGNAAIRAEGAILGNHDVYYDLNQSGRWQKLDMSFKCSGGLVTIYLYINKGGVTDFSKLKGYSIFAHPEFIMTPKMYKDSSNQSSFIYSEKTYDYGNRIEKKHVVVNSNLFSSDSHLYKASFLNFQVDCVLKILSIVPKEDPIRNWIAKVISEDTTYHGYNSILDIGPVSGDFASDRILRWNFAWQIFTSEYSWSKKIFGGGFNFLNWYGFYFYNDKAKNDYPHNPLLAILLYSGVLGLCLYLILLSKVFYYFWKYVKGNEILYIFFIITFFFSFFSSGTPFDPPLMGFFVILSFLMRDIYEIDNQV
jgi:hypothetical protein